MTAEERAAKIMELYGLSMSDVSMEFLASHIREAEEDILGQDLQRRMAKGCSMTLKRFKVIRQRVANFSKREGVNEPVDPSSCINWLNDAIKDRKDLFAYCEYLEVQLQYLAEDHPNAQRLMDSGYNAGVEVSAKVLGALLVKHIGNPAYTERIVEIIRDSKVEVI